MVWRGWERDPIADPAGLCRKQAVAVILSAKAGFLLRVE